MRRLLTFEQAELLRAIHRRNPKLTLAQVRMKAKLEINTGSVFKIIRGEMYAHPEKTGRMKFSYQQANDIRSYFKNRGLYKPGTPGRRAAIEFIASQFKVSTECIYKILQFKNYATRPNYSRGTSPGVIEKQGS